MKIMKNTHSMLIVHTTYSTLIVHKYVEGSHISHMPVWKCHNMWENMQYADFCKIYDIHCNHVIAIKICL